MRHAQAITTLAALVMTGATSAASAADWYTGAPTDVAADDYIVAIDGAATVTSNSSAFGVVTATIAPITPLNESGPRLRLQGLAGVYSYPGSTSGRTVRGEQEEGTAMFGYEWIWKQAALAGYVGFNVRSNALSVLDPNNPVVGTGVGASSRRTSISTRRHRRSSPPTHPTRRCSGPTTSGSRPASRWPTGCSSDRKRPFSATPISTSGVSAPISPASPSAR